MAVLGRNMLDNHGPYIRFSVVDFPIDKGNLSKGNVFIELSEDLLSAYCSMTKSYSPFDIYSDYQFEKPYDIYEFTAKLLLWELQLSRTPEYYFSAVYDDIQPSKVGKSTHAELKADMLETLHFIVGEMHKAATLKKCVHIIGI